MRAAHSSEVQYIPRSRVPAAPSAEEGWMCTRCGVVCDTPRLLALHRWHSHKERSEASTVAVGSRCEVCGVEFWEQPRLREHLKQQAHCRQVYVQGDQVDAERSPSATSARLAPCNTYSWPAAFLGDSVAGRRPVKVLIDPTGAAQFSVCFSSQDAFRCYNAAAQCPEFIARSLLKPVRQKTLNLKPASTPSPALGPAQSA